MAMDAIQVHTSCFMQTLKSEENVQIEKESDYTGAKFCCQMPFISSSDPCSRI